MAQGSGARAGVSAARRVSRASVLRRAAAGGGALLLAACGLGGPPAQEQGPAAATGPVTLQFLTQTLEEFPAVFELLKQKMPQVSVEIAHAAGFAFVEKAKTMGAAGTPPDFSFANVRFIPALTDAGLLHDANSYYKKEKLDLAGVPKGIVDDYTWKGQLTTLPMDIGLGYIRYNKTLIERAGQPDPGQLWQEKRWTWDAFVSLASAMGRSAASEAERVGYVLRTWEGDYLTVVRTHGGELLNRDRTKLALEDNAGVTALTEWAALATRHRAANPPDVNPQGGFNAGQLAMVASHPGEIQPLRKALKDAGAQWRWDVVPHPAPVGKRAVPTLFSNGFSLWKNAGREAVTGEALKRLVGNELMLEWGVRTGRQPARTSLTPEYGKRLEIPAQDPQGYIKLVQELENAVRGLDHSPSYAEWHQVVVDEILKPVGKGERSAQDATRNAAPAINAILART